MDLERERDRQRMWAQYLDKITEEEVKKRKEERRYSYPIYTSEESMRRRGIVDKANDDT